MARSFSRQGPCATNANDGTVVPCPRGLPIRQAFLRLPFLTRMAPNLIETPFVLAKVAAMTRSLGWRLQRRAASNDGRNSLYPLAVSFAPG
jgi:hypothetical protein